MKFLCPSCKAKYQVADEKVVGRSMRMKCRRCAYLIALSDAPPAPATLAPADGELLPRLPGPPAAPNFGPPWTSQPRATPSASPARAAPPALRPGQVQGAAAFAVATSAEPEVSGGVTPASDDLPALAPEEWFVAIQGAPSGPMALSELRKRAGGGEITLKSLVWREGDESWRPLSAVPELAAIVEEQLSSVQAAVAPLEAALPTPPPLPAAPKLSEPPAPASRNDRFNEDLAAAGLSRPRLPVAAWLAVIVALLLGLTVGFVVFGGKKPAPVAKVISPSPDGAASARLSVEDAPPAPPAELPVASAPIGKPAAQVAGRPNAPAPAAGKPTPDVKGLSEPTAQVGPSGEAPSGGGGPLDTATIESTVARYKASVKRSCWQPALEARADGAPTSARVNVALTIAPSGAVNNVTTSADPKGYGGLASCIAGRVRGWQFPASGAPTNVNVPFMFAGQ